MTPQTNNATWAVVYARRGWRIFPVWWIEDGVCACQKYGGDYCKKVGCEPGNYGKHMVVDFSIGMTSWTRDATRDEETVREIWGRYPRAGIGFEPGGQDLIAIDVDPRHGGDRELEDWEKFNSLDDDGGPVWLPATMTSISGSGGYHYIFKNETGIPCQSMNNWLPGVDIKSSGGYIVLPPSEHRSGNRYKWSDDTLEAVTLDHRVIKSIGNSVVGSRSGVSGVGSGKQLTRTTDDIIRNGFVEGGVGDPDSMGRDEGLFKLAARLRRQMGPESIIEVTRMIMDAARACKPPFPDAQAEAKVRSAFSYPFESIDLREIWPNWDAEPEPGSRLETLSKTSESVSAETPAATSEEVPAPDPRSSWAPMDISEFTAGTNPAAEPEYLEREDDKTAFYKGKINEVHGASESLKTWLVLHAVRDALRDGARVAYVDFENGPQEIVGRLLAMGAKKEWMDERLRYRQPEEPVISEKTKDTERALVVVEDVRRLIKDEQADMTVIDGLNEALALHSLSPNDAAEVLVLKQKLLAPMADAGSCVILIDHTSKAGDQGFATGSQQKKALVTGCAFLVELDSVFGRGMVGKAELTVTKDRAGWVRPSCDEEKKWGTLVLISNPVTGDVQSQIQVPATTVFTKAGVLTERCDKILSWMTRNPGVKTGTDVKQGVGMKSNYVSNALRQLESEGKIHNGGSEKRPKWSVVDLTTGEVT